jgi:AcrR family transcriptional regulator
VKVIDQSSRVEQRRALRTDAILDRAMEIAEIEGYEALTLQRLALSMGLVTTALYRYFPSKDALSSALQRRAIGILREHFTGSAAALEAGWSEAATPTRALAGVLALARTYLELPRTQPRAWFFVAVLLGDPRPLLSDDETARARPLMKAFLDDVTIAFERASNEGALHPGDARARVLSFWAALHGAHALEKVRRLVAELPPAQVIGESAARDLLVRWGASPSRMTAAQNLVDAALPAAPRGGDRARRNGGE